MIVYGIKNCNTVKTALDWLRKNKVEFEFHDYKAKGVAREKLNSWISQIGWEKLVNKKGTTWRQLDDETKSKVADETSAIRLMMEKTSVIKRPLLEQDEKVLALGFDEKEYERIFS
jgi:arsenate reductase